MPLIKFRNISYVRKKTFHKRSNIFCEKLSQNLSQSFLWKSPLKSSRVRYISLVLQSIVPSSSSPFYLHRRRELSEKCMHEDTEKSAQLPSAAKSPEERKKSKDIRQDYNISNKQSVFEIVGVGQVARVKLKRFDEFRWYLPRRGSEILTEFFESSNKFWRGGGGGFGSHRGT